MHPYPYHFKQEYRSLLLQAIQVFLDNTNIWIVKNYETSDCQQVYERHYQIRVPLPSVQVTHTGFSAVSYIHLPLGEGGSYTLRKLGLQ